MPDPIHDTSQNASNAGSTAFTAGQELAGSYILKSILSWGTGPGVTWAARDENAGKEVALHILPGTVLQDAAALRGLRLLARKSRAVIHPHIVRIDELVETPDWAALRMDFVEGGTLAALQASRENGRFEPEEIKPWIFQLCETLRDARRAQLPPLELSPTNLIVSPEGRLLVASFGGGGARKETDDVHALGALIHELLTGKAPSEAGDAPLPKEWAPVVAACLDEDPARRPANAMDVAFKLGMEKQKTAGPPGDGAAILLTPAAGTPAVPDEGREGCRFPGLAVVAAVILVGIVTAALYFANRGAPQTSPETAAAPSAVNVPSPAPTPVKAQGTPPAPSPTPVAAASPNITTPSKQLGRQQAEAALQEAIDNVDEKAGLASAAAQSATEAASLAGQKQQAKQLADAASAAAQQAAADKARAALEADKAAAEAAGEAKKQAATANAAQANLEEAKNKVVEARQIAAAALTATTEAAASPSAAASPTASAAASASAPAASPEATVRVMRAEPVLPARPSTTPLDIRVANPKTPIERTLTNSLGMRFAPVGNVLFGIWVTRVQDFAAFVNATGYSSAAWKDPGFEQASSHPVVYVSWEDATSFCKWLTQKEQKAGLLAPNQYYRLPTDFEWSKAVGLPDEAGGTPEARDMDVPSVFPWGTQWPPPHNAGNYTGEETNSDVAIKGYNDGYVYTSPVGVFPPNKFGLYDMGGNVSQWCMDSWNLEQRAKVLRGGSWYNGALRLSLLSSCRVHAPPETSTDNWGFRCVIASDGAVSPRK